MLSNTQMLLNTHMLSNTQIFSNTEIKLFVLFTYLTLGRGVSALKYFAYYCGFKGSFNSHFECRKGIQKSSQILPKENSCDLKRKTKHDKELK